MVVPYSTWLSDASSVVQLTVAPVVVSPLDCTLEITGDGLVRGLICSGVLAAHNAQQRDAIRHVITEQESRDVCFDAGLADAEIGRDLLVRQTALEQIHDVELPMREGRAWHVFQRI